MISERSGFVPPKLVPILPEVLPLPKFIDTESSGLEEDFLRLQLELPDNLRTQVAIIGMTNPHAAIEMTARYLTPTPERYEQEIKRHYEAALSGWRPQEDWRAKKEAVDAWVQRMHDRGLLIFGGSWLAHLVEQRQQAEMSIFLRDRHSA